MDAARLMQTIIEYGADEKGINDRFMGNAKLYKDCFDEFLTEPNLAVLDVAIKEKDYSKAFSAAHALKGLSGNLGVTPFFDAVCVLVEALRAKDYTNVDAQYACVKKQLNRLKSLTSDQLEAVETEAEEPKLPKKKIDHFYINCLCVLIMVVFFVGVMFCRVFTNYKDNISKESADHLMEISYQMKLYIEEKIANDWKIARSVGDSIEGSNLTDNEDIFSLLKKKKEVWNVTDLMLYTENGYGVCVDGDVLPSSAAANAIEKARRNGEFLSISDSRIIYTVPVYNAMEYNGSTIAAVSVVQSMETFLDDMGFTSFDGKAKMYLTEENGLIISTLTVGTEASVLNFTALVQDRQLMGLNESGLTSDDLLTVDETTAFMMTGGKESDYVVSTPIDTFSAPLRLFYLAPTAAVNETMSNFSLQLIYLSIFFVFVFFVLALIVFLVVYKNRKKQFDEALHLRELMFDLLINNTQTAFGLFTVNQKTPTYVSSNNERVVGDKYFTLFKSGDNYLLKSSSGQETDATEQVNEMLKSWNGKTVFKSGFIKNDKTIPTSYFEVQFYPVDSASADYVGIAQDVTQVFDREKATRDALDMAEQANEAKSRFLSNMSHDIRTPMNAIVNMTEFAMESMDQPKKLAAFLQTISESSGHLLRIINDVLDMSRIESGQTVVTSEPFDILAELKRQVDIIRPLCSTKNQTLIVNFDGLNTTAVVGDQLKFSQVIMNLLSNAVKFTPENGAVRLTASDIPSLREDMVDIRFMVEDNGIGISEDFIAHIFEPFSRADNHRVSQIEGTGLGLTICHSYVTAMGGTLSCESEEGEGSVFTMELFFQKAEVVPETMADPVKLGKTPFLGKRCLVCEDNGINQTIAKTMLERLGFMVDIAADGRESVEKFQSSKPGCYDIIYMDIQMPILDGYMAAVAIRESSHPQAATVAIVAMTANVFAEDIEKARIAGMDGHLGKPLMSLELIEETNKAISKRKARYQSSSI